MSLPTFIKGPCLITFDGQKLWSQAGVEIDLRTRTFGIQTDAHGTVDERLGDAYYTISFTPTGSLDNTLITKVLASINAQPGSQLFTTGSPKVLTIKPLLSGQTGFTFHNVALTKLPSLMLSATKQNWGALTFTAVRVDEFGTADSIVTSLAYGAVTDTPEQSEIVTRAFTGIWDADPTDPDHAVWTGIQTADGWTIDFNQALSENTSDAGGLSGMTRMDTGIVIKATPLTVTVDEVLAALHTQENASGTKVRGASMAAALPTARKLYLADVLNYYQFTFNTAALVAGKAAWGSGKNRVGELEWHVLRRFSGGAQLPLAALVIND